MEVGLLLLLGGVAAGLFGSLLGLGGGLLIVPLLTLGFGLPLREAVGVSLVCVIVTSSASAGVYLQRRQANLRLGMVLELFTGLGAVIGGAIAFLVEERLLAGLFAVILGYVAVSMIRAAGARRAAAPATGARTTGAQAPAEVPPEVDLARASDDELLHPEPDDDARTVDSDAATLGLAPARVRRMPVAAVASIGAGVASALLGIGGGLVKVPLMHLGLGVPLRIATATSNLMVGITASTSAIVYLLRGGIDAYAAGPTAVGVFIGASLGSRLGHRVQLSYLRLIFVAVLLYTAFEMARRALGLA
ncbi:MAG TPA: sulfite exporter TauE/SafE family protein [Candidatus Binatia bacterium]|nr:sulfite exporter TauE/SafE family protein [Candidatus Binatia bacterium]